MIRPLVKYFSSRIWDIRSHLSPLGPVRAGVMNFERISVSERFFLSMEGQQRGLMDGGNGSSKIRV